MNNLLIGQKMYKVTHEFTDRGTPFVPMAILLNKYHGIGLSVTQTFYGKVSSTVDPKKPTFGFNLDKFDKMSFSGISRRWS